MTAQPVPIHTDRVRLDRACKASFEENHVEVNGHVLYQPETPGRHFPVSLYDGKRTIISVRRLAYALQNPHDCVRSHETVIVTCEHKGDPSTGQGCCLAHLKKVSLQ